MTGYSGMNGRSVARTVGVLRRIGAACAAVPGLVLLFSLCTGTAFAQVPSFVDHTQGAGVSFLHDTPLDTPGRPMHAGGTVGDFNKDGFPDLFVVGSGMTADRLFINNGDGTFTDQAASAGLTDLYRGVGASVADYDDDGDLDLFVTSMGDMSGDPAGGQHRLYRNNGGLTFTNVAVDAGVNETAPYADGYGSTWGDYDLDGDLDLFVCGWHLDENGETQGNRLFQNNGDGTFTDVTVAAGVYDPECRGFSPVFADMNGDRRPELLIAADFGTSLYFVNNGDGTFTEVDFLMPGSELAEAGMGQTLGEFNRDGRLDWFITAIYPGFGGVGPDGNRLYINQGDDLYEELPESAGVNDGGWAWGTAALDFDHDGWMDIVATNGWDVCDSTTGECFTDEPSYLFRNNHDDTFTEMGQLIGLDHTFMGRGLVHFDYDRDGDMDITIFSKRDSLKLFQNDLSGPNINWLEIVLDTDANPALAPDGWGSRIQINAGAGRPQMTYMHYGCNYLSHSEMIAHFGLRGVPMLDEVIIEWTDGFRTVLNDVAANQLLEVSAQLPYSHDPLVRGTEVDLVLEGLAAGERAYFIGSVAGLGEGPCYPFLGDLCVDILSPFLIGTADADANGTATLTLTVPMNPSVTTVATQAVIRRGPGGAHSLKSNAIEADLIDP